MADVTDNDYLDAFSEIIAYSRGTGAENGLAIGNADFIQSTASGLKYNEVIDRDEGLRKSAKIVGSIETLTDPFTGFESVAKTPGKYTGEMRKVVQCLISHGHPIPYNYMATQCHGIYTAADNSKWVIQISNLGVHAVALPVRTSTLTDDTWLGYSPVGTTPNFDSIELMDASTISVFYEKSYVFKSCGWAFNSTGHEAQNTCVTSGAGQVSKGYLYKITISETSNTPSSASITLVESGEFALPKYYDMKVPDDTEQYLTLLSNQDGQTGSGGYGTFSAPRYVFYDDTDTAIVVRSKGTAETFTASKPDPVSSWTPYTDSYNPSGYMVVYWPTRVSLWSDSWSLNWGTNITESSYGTVADGYSVGKTISGTNVYYQEMSRIDSPRGNTGWNGIYQPSQQVKRLTIKKWLKNSGTVSSSVDMVVVPLGERQAVYQYRYSSKSGNKYTYVNYQDSSESRYTANFKYGESGTCREVSYVGYNSNPYYSRWTDSTLQRGINTQTMPPVVGQDLCSSNRLTAQRSVARGNATTSAGFDLQLLTSTSSQTILTNDSGADSTGISSYNQVTTPTLNPQWMYVITDNASADSYIASGVMNADTYNEFNPYNINETTYVIDTNEAIGNKTFWYGDPQND